MSILRDWSQLPEELVELISTKIISAVDYIRFRAVCSSWRSSSSATPRHLPPQFPWLLLPSPDPKSRARLFLSVSDGKIFSHDLHEAEGQRCCGSSHGWLVLEKKGKFICLFNPITKARIGLPPLRRVELDGDDKAIILANPSLNLNDTFVVVIHGFAYWAFCRIGGDSWTKVHIRTKITDITYHNGRFYSLDVHGKITTYSTKPMASSSGSVIASVPPHDNSCFVASSSAAAATTSELLLLTWNHKLQNNEGYTVYTLDLDSGQQTPNAVTNIGDEMLFWDGHACLAFSVSNFSAWKSNHICYPSFFYVESYEEGDLGSYALVLLNLQNGRSVHLPYNLGPALLNWPAPILFSPCLF